LISAIKFRRFLVVFALQSFIIFKPEIVSTIPSGKFFLLLFGSDSRVYKRGQKELLPIRIDKAKKRTYEKANVDHNLSE